MFKVSNSIFTSTKKVNFLLLGLMFLVLSFSSLAATKDARADDTLAPTGLDTEEQAFVGMLNDYRHNNGLGDLVVDPAMQAPVRWMAQDLATANYFSHTDSQGRDPFQRMAAFGVDRPWEGENLAAGRGLASEALVQWINSPLHNQELLTAEYHNIGIARYYLPGSTYGWYWALDFSN